MSVSLVEELVPVAQQAVGPERVLIDVGGVYASSTGEVVVPVSAMPLGLDLASADDAVVTGNVVEDRIAAGLLVKKGREWVERNSFGLASIGGSLLTCLGIVLVHEVRDNLQFFPRPEHVAPLSTVLASADYHQFINWASGMTMHFSRLLHGFTGVVYDAVSSQRDGCTVFDASAFTLPGHDKVVEVAAVVKGQAGEAVRYTMDPGLHHVQGMVPGCLPNADALQYMVTSVDNGASVTQTIPLH